MGLAPMTEKYVETLRLMTQAWQCDHLGHVNVSFYMGWIAMLPSPWPPCMAGRASR